MGLGNDNDDCVFVCYSYQTNYFFLIISVLSKCAFSRYGRYWKGR